MKILITAVALFLCCSILNGQTDRAAKERKIMFACPPCGCNGDTIFQNKPGFCTDCGAELYPIFSDMVNEDKNKPATPKTVAILVFPGAELIDFTGPWEVLSAAGMQVWSVAKNDTAFTCTPGLTMKPDYTFGNCPQPDILLIPGGGVDPGDTITVNWIKSISNQTEHTVSVCTGAYYLGAAGMLDNKTATTFYPALEDFKKNYPAVKVVDDARFVDNGKVITSAGLTSGIDAAFHIVSLYQGNAQSQKLANLLEYNWTPSSNYVRGKLADKYLINLLYLFTPFEYTIKKYQGNTDHWLIDILLQSELSQSDIEKLLTVQAVKMEKWKPSQKKNEWLFKRNSLQWICAVSIKCEKGNKYAITLKTAKAR